VTPDVQRAINLARGHKPDPAQLLTAATEGPWMYLRDFRCIVANPEVHGNTVTYDLSIVEPGDASDANAELMAEAPRLAADLAQAQRDAEHWEAAAAKNGELYAACENQRDDLRAAHDKVRNLVAEFRQMFPHAVVEHYAKALLAALDGDGPKDET